MTPKERVMQLLERHSAFKAELVARAEAGLCPCCGQQTGTSTPRAIDLNFTISGAGKSETRTVTLPLSTITPPA